MAGFDSANFKLRWQRLTLAEQLGNVGSEVDRAISWRRRGDPARSGAAFERSLELLDLSIADLRWRAGRRLRELTRARELLCEAFCLNMDLSSLEFLSRYFYHFAHAARLRRQQGASRTASLPT